MIPFLKQTVLLVHHEQLAEHGGMAGVRDEGMLESAMARAENKMAYGAPDVFEIAAAYAFGIIKNHPFVDGNKRTGYVLAETWLFMKGVELMANDVECVQMTLALAASEITETRFAQWLRDNASAE